jgi:hypothetical protein
MREVISLNGMFIHARQTSGSWLSSVLNVILNLRLTVHSIVGQAGCQIANSCWEVRVTTSSRYTLIVDFSTDRFPTSSTALSMAFRLVKGPK